MRYEYKDGEKLTRFSIRKYHFGAASVAVASLIFFGGGMSAKAENIPVSQDSQNVGNTSNAAPNVDKDASGDSGNANKTIKVDVPVAALPAVKVEKEELSKLAIKLETLVKSTEKEKISNISKDLDKVLSDAKEVLKNEKATAEEVKTQVEELTKATKKLEETVAETDKKAEETKQIGENRSATVEAGNTETSTPARSSRGRRGRTTEVQPEASTSETPKVEAAASNKETASKELPTYKNGADTYKLAEEMGNIVTYLRKNGADAAKVAVIKANYDKLNEILGAHEDGVLSEEDFNKALADLKQARDFTEGFLNNQSSTQSEALPVTRRSRAIGQIREGSNHFNIAKEYYYEDGTKGSSPYDKYTYVFHTFTESLVANNANHSPVRDVRRLVYEEVNEVNGGYLWTITFNAAHEDQQDGYAFFSIPKGQRVENNSINIVKTDQNGNEAEISGSGDLLSRLQNIHPNSSLRGREIGIRRNGGPEEESLEGLAKSKAYAGYYTRRLEEANGETRKSDDMFNRIADNTQSVYRFQLHGRDSYSISFKTTNTNNTRMDKLYYASGYRVQQWGRRILAQQWHGRHAYDKDDTDRFPLHVVGNGTFLIKQGKHYNTSYPQGAYGFGGRNFDYQPFKADGILGYDASGAYNSNFDMHQYTAPVGSNTPSSNTKATTAGQKFEFYDKEGNKLSASQIGMHGADKPGLVEYKVKRTFADKSSDFLNIKFAIQPKTPTFTENLSKARGQVKTLTVSNGTDGYPITLFREYVENGVTKTERVKTVNAGRNGSAVFNDVLIKSGKYYAQSIIPTSAYLDYKNNKHTDVRSDKSALVTVGGDGMAPTIKVGETGKALATTPANNQVTLFVTPNNKGEVSLDVQIQDDELGDGMNAFSSAANGNAKYSITGAHNSGATTFTAKGGVTGGKTVNALLKVKLNGTTIPNGGLTVTLNAKDKADNWTNTATPSKTLTVKLLSAVPNEPAVREITGADVQNGAIKPEVKNQVLQNVKNANPDLVNAGVKFEYDTTAGNTDKIKVTYPDGQTRLLTPMKGRKPTAPSVVGPADGTVSITPQGDTDKVIFQYVPTNETNPKTIIAKKDGNSWAIQGTRPNGITVDSRSGKITITEPTVKDQSTVTATATFLNSDTSDAARDTAKNPDREAPTVSIKTGDGRVRTLTANAADNKFLVYRGATFNPTFIVNDNSGTTDNFMIRNIPNGVWFNKQGGRDVPHTGVSNGREITFSNQVVDPITPLGTREAIVSVRDKNGNAAEYKFQYIIADVLLKNSPKSVATGSELGDSHQFVASTLNGTTSNADVYFPGDMKFLWANNETSKTTLPNSAQTVTKEAIVEFPDTALNGRTTAAGITIYAPKQIKKNVTFNLADNAKPQATLNGISIGQTAGDPIFTVFRGANFNPQLEAWDNSGKITNVTISGLPTNVTATPFPGGVQTGSENSKYTARLSNGVVPADQALGEYEATLTVQGDGSKDTSVLKFKYRVVDMEFKNGYETTDTGQQTGKSYVIGLKNGQSVNLANGDNNINPKDYWKVIDDANKTDRGYAYLPEGVSYSIGGGAISSNPADKSKGASVAMGHYARGVSVDFTRAGEGDKVGDIANDNSTSRTIFTPRTIDRRLLVAVDPSAPTIDGGEDLLYGKAGERPDIKVKEIVNIGESDADVGTVNKFAIRTIQLYSDRDPNTPIAEHAFAQGSRETEYTFRGSDYATSRPNGLLPDETLYSRVKVTHRGVSTLSGNSNEKEVTAKLPVTENSTNRIIQANDQKLNDAEKTGIRIALRNANQRLNLNDEDIEISDSGEIVITKDKKRAFLQANPNKKEGNTTTGFITRFADIRKDYKFENIEGLKVPGRDTDKGFAWSNSTSKDNVNGDRSLIYYYDATKGQSFNFNEVLNLLNLKEGWTVNHTENPSFIATQGVNKVKGEQGRDGFSQEKPSTAFLKDGNYINVIDLVEKASLGGAKNVSNSANKLVENGKAGGTGTTLQNVTIAAANGLPQFTLNNVVNGEQAIHKAQVYLRPKWVTSGTLAERNGETKDNTTNVVNLYFVPIDSIKPIVGRSDSNNLGTSADDAPRLTDTSITASSLVKVTDNYDKDDVTDSNSNSVRNKLNVWVKKDGVETQVVRNGQELTTTTGETVLGSLIKTADPATYELVGQATDTSGNISEKESLGFFKVGYNLTVRPVINLIQFEKLTDDEKRTLIQVNEGGQTDELPAGSTVQLTFDTDTDGQGKKAVATIKLPNGATTTKEVTYNVDLSFPVASKVYDFAGVRRNSTDPNYYLNRGLVQGMNWYVKKETEENGQKVFKDVPPKANPNEHVMPREINKDIDPTTGGVGEYKYILGAIYPKGRYTATATDELSKLRREGEIIHTVFDVKANTNEITVNSGDSLTDSQAETAVIKTDNSPELPTGTTYEWVNQDGSALTDKTVTGQGSVTRYVKVTLPKTEENGPWATQVQQSKIVPVTVQLEKEAPTAKIKLGNNTPVALTENAEDNRFVIFKGATFNPTFIVDDNSGTTASINITNLPNGRSVNKTEAMSNGTNVNLEGDDAATSGATTGTREASVVVTDAAGNAKTYKFKYTVVDVNLVNSPKEVPLDTKLGDSHAFAAVDKADLTVSNPDSLYPGGMIFEWKKNDQVVSNDAKLNEPGRITGYKAVVKFKGGAGFYTVNGVKTFTPTTIEKDVIFLVKPTAPTVTPKDNGDVEITPTNQTNVDKVSVTFTKQDDSTEVTYTAKKNSRGVWEFGSGAPLTVDPTTGVFKLKDIKVKDGSTVTAKAITTDVTGGVESTPATAIAGNGDAILPTVTFKNVEIDAQGNRVVYITPTEETNLDIATITDNSNKLLEAVIFDQSTKDITLGNYGLTYNKLVRNGDTIMPAPYILNVTGTLSREKSANTLWNNGDVIVSRYVSAMDAAENNIKDKNGSRDNVTTNPYRVIFKVKTQAAKYTPTTVAPVIERDITEPGASLSDEEFNKIKDTLTFTADKGTVNVNKDVTGLTFISDKVVKTKENGSLYVTATVTYPDGSTETVEVPVNTLPKSKVPRIAKENQDPTSGNVTYKVTDPDGNNYPEGSKVTINGNDYPVAADGTVTVPNDKLPEAKTNETPKVKEDGKLPKAGNEVEVPAKLVDSKVPRIAKENQDPTSGNVTYKVTDPDGNNYPEGSKVTINGNDYPVAADGTVTVPNDKLPEAKTNETPKVKEDGKLPKAGNEVEVPAKLVDSKVPRIAKENQDPTSGNVTYKVTDPDGNNYPEGSKVTINGNDYPVAADGTVTVPNDKLPEAKTNETPKVKEDGKLPKAGNEVEVPAKLVDSKVPRIAKENQDPTSGNVTYKVTDPDGNNYPEGSKVTINGNDYPVAADGTVTVPNDKLPEAKTNETPKVKEDGKLPKAGNEVEVPAKLVDSKVPRIAKENQDPTSGNVTYKVTDPDGNNYPEGSKVTINGNDYPVAADGTVTVPNDKLPEAKTNETPKVKEDGKLPKAGNEVEVPAKLVDSKVPRIAKENQDPTSGNVTYKVTDPDGNNYPEGSKVTINGNDYPVAADGTVTVPNDKLPEAKTNETPKVKEDGKLPKAGNEVEVPAKLVDSKVPRIAKENQDPTSGNVTYKVTDPDGNNYPEGSKVTINGNDYPVAADGTVTVPNDKLPEAKTNETPKVKEDGKLPKAGNEVEVPAKLVDSKVPRIAKENQDPTSGNVTYKVTDPDGNNYPEGSKVTINGNDYPVAADGTVTVPNDKLPEAKTNETPKVKEDGKLPKAGNEVEVPAKLVDSKVPRIAKENQDPTSGNVTYKVTDPDGNNYPEGSKVTINGNDYPVAADGTVTVPNDKLPEAKTNETPKVKEDGKLPKAGNEVEVPAKLVDSKVPRIAKENQDPTSGNVTYKVTDPDGNNYPEGSKVTINGNDYPVAADGTVTVPNDKLPEAKTNETPKVKEDGKLPKAGNEVEVPAKLVDSKVPRIAKENQDPTSGNVTYKVTDPDGNNYPEGSKVTINGNDYPVAADGTVTVPNDKLPEAKTNETPKVKEDGKLPKAGNEVEVPAKLVDSKVPRIAKENQDPTSGNVTYKVTDPDGNNYPEGSKVTINGNDYPVAADGTVTVPNDKLPEAKTNETPKVKEDGKLPKAGNEVEVPAKLVDSKVPRIAKENQDPTSGNVTYKVTDPDGNNYPEGSKVTINGNDYPVAADGTVTVPNDKLPEAKTNETPKVKEDGKLPKAGNEVEVPAKLVDSKVPRIAKENQDPTSGNVTYKVTDPDGNNYPEGSKVTINGNDYPVAADGTVTVPNDKLPEAKTNETPKVKEDGKLPKAGNEVEVPAKLVDSKVPRIAKENQDPTSGNVTYKVTDPDGNNYPEGSKVTINGNDYPVAADGTVTVPNDKLPEAKTNETPKVKEDGKLPKAGNEVEVPAKLVDSKVPRIAKENQDPTSGNVTYKVTDPDGNNYPEGSKVTINGNDYPVAADGTVTVPNDKLPEAKTNETPKVKEDGKLPKAGNEVEVPAKLVDSKVPRIAKENQDPTSGNVTYKVTDPDGNNYPEGSKVTINGNDYPVAADGTVTVPNDKLPEAKTNETPKVKEDGKLPKAGNEVEVPAKLVDSKVPRIAKENQDPTSGNVTYKVTDPDGNNYPEGSKVTINGNDYPVAADGTVTVPNDKLPEAKTNETPKVKEDGKLPKAGNEVEVPAKLVDSKVPRIAKENQDPTSGNVTYKVTDPDGNNYPEGSKVTINGNDYPVAADGTVTVPNDKLPEAKTNETPKVKEDGKLPKAGNEVEVPAKLVDSKVPRIAKENQDPTSGNVTYKVTDPDGNNYPEGSKVTINGNDYPVAADGTVTVPNDKLPEAKTNETPKVKEDGKLPKAGNEVEVPAKLVDSKVPRIAKENQDPTSGNVTYKVTDPDGNNYPEGSKVTINGNDYPVAADGTVTVPNDKLPEAKTNETPKVKEDGKLPKAGNEVEVPAKLVDSKVPRIAKENQDPTSGNVTYKVTDPDGNNYPEGSKVTINGNDYPVAADGTVTVPNDKLPEAKTNETPKVKEDGKLPKAGNEVEVPAKLVDSKVPRIAKENQDPTSGNVTYKVTDPDGNNYPEGSKVTINGNDYPVAADGTVTVPNDKLPEAKTNETPKVKEDGKLPKAGNEVEVPAKLVDSKVPRIAKENQDPTSGNVTYKVTDPDGNNYPEGSKVTINGNDYPVAADGTVTVPNDKLPEAKTNETPKVKEDGKLPKAGNEVEVPAKLVDSKVPRIAKENQDPTSGNVTYKVTDPDGNNYPEGSKVTINGNDYPVAADGTVTVPNDKLPEAKTNETPKVKEDGKLPKAGNEVEVPAKLVDSKVPRIAKENQDPTSGNVTYKVTDPDGNNYPEGSKVTINGNDYPVAADGTVTVPNDKLPEAKTNETPKVKEDGKLPKAGNEVEVPAKLVDSKVPRIAKENQDPTSGNVTYKVTDPDGNNYPEGSKVTINGNDYPVAADGTVTVPNDKLPEAKTNETPKVKEDGKLPKAGNEVEVPAKLVDSKVPRIAKENQDPTSGNVTYKVTDPDGNNYPEGSKVTINGNDYPVAADGTVTVPNDKLPEAKTNETPKVKEDGKLPKAGNEVEVPAKLVDSKVPRIAKENQDPTSGNVTYKVTDPDGNNYPEGSKVTINGNDYPVAADGTVTVPNDKLPEAKTNETPKVKEDGKLPKAGNEVEVPAKLVDSKVPRIAKENQDPTSGNVTYKVTDPDGNNYPEGSKVTINGNDYPVAADGTVTVPNDKLPEAKTNETPKVKEDGKLPKAGNEVEVPAKLVDSKVPRIAKENQDPTSGNVTYKVTDPDGNNYPEGSKVTINGNDYPVAADGTVTVPNDKLPEAKTNETPKVKEDGKLPKAGNEVEVPAKLVDSKVPRIAKENQDPTSGNVTYKVTDPDGNNYPEGSKVTINGNDYPVAADGTVTVPNDKLPEAKTNETPKVKEDGKLPKAGNEVEVPAKLVDSKVPRIAKENQDPTSGNVTYKVTDPDGNNYPEGSKVTINGNDYPVAADGTVTVPNDKLPEAKTNETPKVKEDGKLPKAGNEVEVPAKLVDSKVPRIAKENQDPTSGNVTYKVTDPDGNNYPEGSKVTINGNDYPVAADGTVTVPNDKLPEAKTNETPKVKEDGKLPKAGNEVEVPAKLVDSKVPRIAKENQDPTSGNVTYKVTDPDGNNYPEGSKVTINGNDYPVAADGTVTVPNDKLPEAKTNETPKVKEDGKLPKAGNEVEVPAKLVDSKVPRIAKENQDPTSGNVTYKVTDPDGNNYPEGSKVTINGNDYPVAADGTVTVPNDKLPEAKTNETPKVKEDGKLPKAGNEVEVPAKLVDSKVPRIAKENQDPTSGNVTYKVTDPDGNNYPEGSKVTINGNDYPVAADGTVTVPNDKLPEAKTNETPKVKEDGKLPKAGNEVEVPAKLVDSKVPRIAKENQDPTSGNVTYKVTDPDGNNYPEGSKVTINGNDYPVAADGTVTVPNDKLPEAKTNETPKVKEDGKLPKAGNEVEVPAKLVDSKVPRIAKENQDPTSGNVTYKVTDPDGNNYPEGSKVTINGNDYPVAADGTVTVPNDKLPEAKTNETPKVKEDGKLPKAGNEVEVPAKLVDSKVPRIAKENQDPTSGNVTYKVTDPDGNNYPEGSKVTINGNDYPVAADGTVTVPNDKLPEAKTNETPKVKEDGKLPKAGNEVEVPAKLVDSKVPRIAKENQDPTSGNVTYKVTDPDGNNYPEGSKVTINGNDYPVAADGTVTVPNDKLPEAKTNETPKVKEDGKLPKAGNEVEVPAKLVDSKVPRIAKENQDPTSGNVTYKVTDPDGNNYPEGSKVTINGNDYPVAADGTVTVPNDKLPEAKTNETPKVKEDGKLPKAGNEVEVPAKLVDSKVPRIAKENQDPTSGNVTYKVTDPDGNNYPEGSKVTINGNDYPVAADGTVTVPNDKLPEAKTNETPKVKEDGKLPKAGNEVEVPAKLVDSKVPRIAKENQDPTSGNVTYKVTDPDGNNYPEGSKVTINGNDYPVAADGTVTVPNDKLPEAKTNETPKVKEDGKLPKAGNEVEVPAKLVDSKVPRIAKENQDPTSGNVTYKVTDPDGNNYPEGSKVTINGNDYPVAADGTVTVPNDKLPEAKTNETPKVKEDGKLPKAGNEVEVPAKLVDSKVPRIAKENQDPTSGNVTYKVTDPDGNNYPEGSKVTINGNDYPVAADGTVTVPNDKLPEAKTNETPKVKEDGKLPKAGNEVEVPAKLVDSKVPRIAKENQDPTSGNVTYKVTDPDGNNYPEGSKVTINGNDYPVAADGTVTVPNDKLPEAKTNETPKVKEDGKLPKAGNEVEVPAKLVGTPGVDEEGNPITPPVVEVPEYTGAIGTPGVDEEGNLITPPVVEVPEYTGAIGTPGVDEEGNPIIPPVVEVPEYTGAIGTPGVDEEGNLITPPVVEVPEYTGTIETPGVDEEGNPIMPPVVEVPEYTGTIGTPGVDEEGNPITPPVVEVPEYTGAIGTPGVDEEGNPITPPVVEVPEYTGAIGTPGVDEEGNLITPPVVEVPEYTGTIGTPGVDENGNLITPPVVEVPEYTGTIGTPGVDEEGNQIIPPVVEVPEYTGTIGSTGVDENGNLITPPVVEVPEYTGTISTPGVDENGNLIIPPVVEVPEYTGTIGTPGVDENGNLITPPVVEVPDFKDGVNGELPDPAELPKVQLIITKWTNEDGKELKAADAKAPAVLGEANEALEAGEIEGYEFVRTETKDDVVTHIFRKVTPTKPTKPADNGEEQGGDNKPQPTPTAKVEKATKRLANTGEAETNTGLAGLGLAVLGSLLAVAKRRKKDEE